MTVRVYEGTITTDVPLVTTAETVIATVSGIATNQPGCTIALRGQATFTSGTSATGVTLRVREDSLTGTIVDEPAADALYAAVGSVETHDIAVDFLAAGEYGSKTFVLTAQQIAAVANGNVTQCSLDATVSP
jgi:hypothetical protein